MNLYCKLLELWYPNEIPTKCEALARFRVKCLRQKARRGKLLIERQKLEIHEGKATIFWTAEFRRV